jgi:YVTN family beta-propeller protein
VVLLADAARAASAPQAYITSSGDATISVIDTASNAVTATVIVGATPMGVAVTRDGTHVYVTNNGEDTVSVIDAATNTVTTTVTVGPGPFGLAVTPDGAHVYVANRGEETVSVIETATNTVTNTVMMVGPAPYAVAVAPNGARVYVTNNGQYTLLDEQHGSSQNAVSVIDTATHTVIANVSVGSAPTGLAMSPDGTRVYVANGGDDSVSVIDTATNTVTATFQVGFAAPMGVAVTPDGAHVYVANNRDDTVAVIARATGNVTIVKVGPAPFGVAVTPDGAQVYVANNGLNTVSVIATATNIVTEVTVGSNPAAFGVFISPGLAAPPVPSPVPVPFASFTADVHIKRAHSISKHGGDSFEVDGRGVLGPASNGLAPLTEAVTLSIGSFTLTVPAGSFVRRGKAHDDKKGPRGHDPDPKKGPKHDDDRTMTYTFKGVVAGVSLDAEIEQGPKQTFTFKFKGRHANLGQAANPLTVELVIGDDSGRTVVKAKIDK